MSTAFKIDQQLRSVVGLCDITPEFRVEGIDGLQFFDKLLTRKELSLAESRAECIHACVFPLFYIKDGSQ